MHGGAEGSGAQPGNTNAVAHGLYTNGLLETEKPLWMRIKLGSIDDEIKMARVQLNRVFEAQRKSLENPDDPGGLELVGVDSASETKTGAAGTASGTVTNRSVKRSKPDFHRLAMAYIRLIATLEAKAVDLAKVDPSGMPAPGAPDGSGDLGKLSEAELTRRYREAAAKAGLPLEEPGADASGTGTLSA